jgi:hypothetical protein
MRPVRHCGAASGDVLPDDGRPGTNGCGPPPAAVARRTLSYPQPPRDGTLERARGPEAITQTVAPEKDENVTVRRRDETITRRRRRPPRPRRITLAAPSPPALRRAPGLHAPRPLQRLAGRLCAHAHQAPQTPRQTSRSHRRSRSSTPPRHDPASRRSPAPPRSLLPPATYFFRPLLSPPDPISSPPLHTRPRPTTNCILCRKPR